MSELIDRNVLRAKMYQEAFESDTDMQKWDSGCWIRYKLFEKVVDSTPTVPYGPRWHRVSDGLPKDGQCCLFFTVESGIPERDAWFGIYRNDWEGDINMRFDYWMPIEPPKEER